MVATPSLVRETGTDCARKESGVIPTRPPVLVVEDNCDVREALAEILEQSAYVVVQAGDGREAIQLLKAGLRPGLILLDVMMPVMNGWQFRAEQLRDDQLAGIPTVICSALEAVPIIGPSRGIVGCLPKPIDIDALLAIANRYCGVYAKSASISIGL